MRVVRKNDGSVGRVLIGEYDNKGQKLFYPANYGQYYEKELELLSEIEYTEGTEQDYLQYIEEDFSWGEVIKIHTLGEYQIIEYINDENETSFHPYIKYEDMHTSYTDIEKAIVGAIARKYDGENSQAGKFFWKMIK